MAYFVPDACVDSTTRLTMSLDEFAALALTADGAMRMLATCSDLDVSKRTKITLMLASIRDFVQTKLTDATGEQRKVFGNRIGNETFAEIFAFVDRYSLDSAQMVYRRFNAVITGSVTNVSVRVLHSAKIDATANEVVVKVKPADKDLGRLIMEAKIRRFAITDDALSMLFKVCRSSAIRKLAFKGVPTLTMDVFSAMSEHASSIYVRSLDLDKEIAENVTGTEVAEAVRSFGGVYSLQLRPLSSADENRHVVNVLPTQEFYFSRLSYWGGINDSGLEDEDILKFCFERPVCCGRALLAVGTTRITPLFVHRLVQAANQSNTSHIIWLDILHCIPQNLNVVSADGSVDDDLDISGGGATKNSHGASARAIPRGVILYTFVVFARTTESFSGSGFLVPSIQLCKELTRRAMMFTSCKSVTLLERAPISHLALGLMFALWLRMPLLPDCLDN